VWLALCTSLLISSCSALNLTVNARYYDLVAHLPGNTSVIWGINLGASNTSNALAMGRAITAAFQQPVVKAQNITLRFIEVGNECVPTMLIFLELTGDLLGQTCTRTRASGRGRTTLTSGSPSGARSSAPSCLRSALLTQA
jgi:hypothetical protein